MLRFLCPYVIVAVSHMKSNLPAFPNTGCRSYSTPTGNSQMSQSFLRRCRTKHDLVLKLEAFQERLNPVGEGKFSSRRTL